MTQPESKSPQLKQVSLFGYDRLSGSNADRLTFTILAKERNA